MPPYFFSRYDPQSIACGSSLLLIVSALLLFTVPLLSINLSDFCLLHVQCANCKLLMSLGCPPFAIGIIWSMHADSGCGYFSLKSTGFPHIPQHVCVAYIFFLFFSNAPRCAPSLSALNTFGIPKNFLYAKRHHEIVMMSFTCIIYSLCNLLL